ncbi:hypothetical protein [Telluribacter humicola]|nr:hypothetical protein [Telluribacter humicola]
MKNIKEIAARLGLASVLLTLPMACNEDFLKEDLITARSTQDF